MNDEHTYYIIQKGTDFFYSGVKNGYVIYTPDITDAQFFLVPPIETLRRIAGPLIKIKEIKLKVGRGLI